MSTQQFIGPFTGQSPNPTAPADAAQQALADRLVAGARVRITKQAPRQNGAFAATSEGVVEKREQKKTGSWFAHSKEDRLWLDRLVIRKDDGEIFVCNLDPQTRVEVLEDAPA